MRILGGAGFIATATLIALITLTPQSSYSAHASVSRRLLELLHSAGVPSSFGPVQWELVANIIMFVPLGFFLALLVGPRAWVGMLVLPAMSVAIELSQRAFLPSRYPSIQDVLTNSVGGWIGLALGVALMWFLRQGRNSSDAAPAL